MFIPWDPGKSRYTLKPVIIPTLVRNQALITWQARWSASQSMACYTVRAFSLHQGLHSELTNCYTVFVWFCNVFGLDFLCLSSDVYFPVFPVAVWMLCYRVNDRWPDLQHENHRRHQTRHEKDCRRAGSSFPQKPGAERRPGGRVRCELSRIVA